MADELQVGLMVQEADGLRAIYASLPHIECKRLCFECCGPIVQAGAMTGLEFERLRRYPAQPEDRKDFMRCSLLTPAPDNACSAYDDRPLICRLWGLVDEPRMRCPHGCVPDRWLTQAESYALMAEAERIGGVISIDYDELLTIAREHDDDG